MIIAIDGPAASGKGTLGRRLAEHFGLAYLDTGLTYRAVAADLLSRNVSLDDTGVAAEAAGAIDLTGMDRAALSAHGVGEAASRVAVLPEVRHLLVERQRAFAAQPGGAVLDGRDIGTVVAPDAEVKLFVTANVGARARRRTEEAAARGDHADYDTILADLQRRDARDAGRAVAPLTRASDAHLLDTTEMDIETAFRAAVDIVDRAIARSG